MKKAYIVHGWEEGPDEPMHVWIKEKFEKRGYDVSVLEMPNPSEPTIGEWVEKLREEVNNPDEETIFIGHSIGCQTILRYLETLDSKVGRVFLIAPWTHVIEGVLEEEGEEVVEFARPWIETPIDWGKVKSIAKDFVCFFSDDDFYVPLSEVEVFENNLDAKILILENRKHFDRRSGINDLPEILDFIE